MSSALPVGRRVAAERPALIVWPEKAVPFILRREPELSLRVGRYVAETEVPMLIGSPGVMRRCCYGLYGEAA